MKDLLELNLKEKNFFDIWEGCIFLLGAGDTYNWIINDYESGIWYRLLRCFDFPT